MMRGQTVARMKTRNSINAIWPVLTVVLMAVLLHRWAPPVDDLIGGLPLWILLFIALQVALTFAAMKWVQR